MSTCKQCERELIKKQDESRRDFDKRLFCNKSCYSLWRRGPNHPRYKGGYVNVYGYREISQGGGRAAKLEHRIIAEKALGRALKSTEVVHHWNGNKLDNRPRNLLICTQSYHMELEQRMLEMFKKEHFGDI